MRLLWFTGTYQGQMLQITWISPGYKKTFSGLRETPSTANIYQVSDTGSSSMTFTPYQYQQLLNLLQNQTPTQNTTTQNTTTVEEQDRKSVV